MNRFYWYKFCQQSVKAYYDKRLDLNSEQGVNAYRAVKQAVEDTGKLNNGDYRLQMIDMVYSRQRWTRAGAAFRIHVSERTAQRWDNEFIYLVARYMGFWG